MENDRNRDHWKAFTEEIEVTGYQLVDKVTQLLREGNVRNIRLKSTDGRVFVELPLTVGAGIGGVVALAAPWLAVLAALAGVFAHLKLEVVRQSPPDAAEPGSGTGPRHRPEDIDV